MRLIPSNSGLASFKFLTAVLVKEINRRRVLHRVKCYKPDVSRGCKVFDTDVAIYQPTRRKIPEHLHTQQWPSYETCGYSDIITVNYVALLSTSI